MGHIYCIEEKENWNYYEHGVWKRSLMREVWGSGFWVLWSMLPEITRGRKMNMSNLFLHHHHEPTISLWFVTKKGSSALRWAPHTSPYLYYSLETFFSFFYFLTYRLIIKSEVKFFRLSQDKVIKWMIRKQDGWELLRNAHLLGT